ncbi:MAG: hypothetical protein ABR879_07085 [Methanomassiliicoccales archaeon]|jgi:hypothetical protein
MSEILIIPNVKPKSYRRAWNYIMGGLVALSVIVIVLSILYAG